MIGLVTYSIGCKKNNLSSIHPREGCPNVVIQRASFIRMREGYTAAQLLTKLNIQFYPHTRVVLISQVDCDYRDSSKNIKAG